MCLPHRRRVLLRRSTTAAALTALALPALAQVDGEASAGEFTHQGQEPWDLVLPEERWHPVGEAIEVGDHRFPVEGSAPGLMVDSDGDGRPEQRLRGSQGFLVLRAPDRDVPFRYAIRLRRDDGVWHWAPGGAMKGQIDGVSLRLIDVDGNGAYDDFGVDALIVGTGRVGSHLSRVVHLGDVLMELEVSHDGRRVTTAPYQGPRARLDVQSAFVSHGTLLAAVFRSGEISFNVADAEDGMVVPAGEYQLVSGLVQKGTEIVQVSPGRMAALRLEPGQVRVVEWGAPVDAEFTYRVQGDRLTVLPDVRFFGSAGEEYHGFAPVARAPRVIVRDKATGKLVQYGRMGGCCGRGYSAYVASVPRGIELEITLEHRRALFGSILGRPRRGAAPPVGGRGR